jgi:hypothetical protein
VKTPDLPEVNKDFQPWDSPLSEKEMSVAAPSCDHQAEAFARTLLVNSNHY